MVNLFNIEHGECHFKDSVEHFGDLAENLLEQILDIFLGIFGNDRSELRGLCIALAAAEFAAAGLAAGAVIKTGAVGAAETFDIDNNTICIFRTGDDLAQIKIGAVQAAGAGAGFLGMRFSAFARARCRFICEYSKADGKCRKQHQDSKQNG